jgi:nicotinamide mononucleotide adenylyltransferase
VDQTSNWLMVDPWEAMQSEYQRTAVVLEHFDQELNQGEYGGIAMQDGRRSGFRLRLVVLMDHAVAAGSRKKIKIVLLAGGDLIESFGSPGVWAQQDVSCALSLCELFLNPP